MEILLILLAVQVPVMFYQLIYSRNLKSSLKKAHNKALSTAKKNETLLHSLHLSLENLMKSRELPPLLTNIPFADDTGIVLSVDQVKIHSVTAAYNASIGLFENRYFLFFRYNTPTFGTDSYFSNIGYVPLGQNFEPLENEFSKIETNSTFSEDARFFQSEGRSFLIFNDVASSLQRTIRIGAIDLKKKRLEYITTPHFQSSKMEKNWTPFSHQGDIHFLYTINPQKILSLPDPCQSRLQPSPTTPDLPLNWTAKWGPLRGGTPALIIDGEYLSFFHSSFEDHKGVVWYVMGAYTFAARPPFKMTRISPHPILFKGIYDTPHEKMANPKVRSIYPAGFIYEERDGKERISVSCGENDSGIKIISMDKEALLKSLTSLAQPISSDL